MSYQDAQQRLADRLEQIRTERGMTKKEFCRLCGIGANSYTFYTKGGGMPNLYTTMQIAAALGLSIDQLIGIKGGKPALTCTLMVANALGVTIDQLIELKGGKRNSGNPKRKDM